MKPLEYVRQIENMELELTRWNAARSLVPAPRQLEVAEVGSSIVLRDATDPDSMYYNRIKGFGPLDLPILDKLLSCYNQGAPCLDITPDRMTEDVTRALSERGFFPAEQLVFMLAPPATGFEPNPAFHIERVTVESAEEFIRWISLSKGGASFGAETVARCRSYFYSPNFINYMLRIDGEPAAMGSLFLKEREGYIANDYTFEAFRGRGCQTALLRQRLSDAGEFGVTDIYTDVVFGSISHGNMEKAGFRTAYLNTFWISK